MAARKPAEQPATTEAAEVRVQSPTGAVTTVPAELVDALLASGYSKAK